MHIKKGERSRRLSGRSVDQLVQLMNDRVTNFRWLALSFVLMGLSLILAIDGAGEHGSPDGAAAEEVGEDQAKRGLGKFPGVVQAPHRVSLMPDEDLGSCCVVVVDAGSREILAASSVSVYTCREGESIEEAWLRTPDSELDHLPGRVGIFQLSKPRGDMWIRAQAVGYLSKALLVHLGSGDVEISLTKLAAIQVTFSPPLSEWARQGMKLICRPVKHSGEFAREGLIRLASGGVVPVQTEQFSVAQSERISLNGLVAGQNYMVRARWEETRLSMNDQQVVAPGFVVMSHRQRRGLRVSVHGATTGDLVLRYSNTTRSSPLVGGVCWFDMESAKPGSYSIFGAGDGWVADPALVTWSANDRVKVTDLRVRKPIQIRVLLSGAGYSDETRLTFFELSGTTLIPLRSRIIRLESCHVLHGLEVLPRHLVVFDYRNSRSYRIFCRGDEREIKLRLEESPEIILDRAAEFVREYKGQKGVAMLQVGILASPSGEALTWKTRKKASLLSGGGRNQSFWAIRVPEGVPCRLKVQTPSGSKVFVLR